jgi:hypothetical protein
VRRFTISEKKAPIYLEPRINLSHVPYPIALNCSFFFYPNNSLILFQSHHGKHRAGRFEAAAAGHASGRRLAPSGEEAAALGNSLGEEAATLVNSSEEDAAAVGHASGEDATRGGLHKRLQRAR